mmetsp:Transcript_23486/g.79636  ORF Transcript_23486/g.79636 Transcript_23486/m.79636 type:complete len:245 (-) Transcript_23486:2465-3199(-)
MLTIMTSIACDGSLRGAPAAATPADGGALGEPPVRACCSGNNQLARGRRHGPPAPAAFATYACRQARRGALRRPAAACLGNRRTACASCACGAPLGSFAAAHAFRILRKVSRQRPQSPGPPFRANIRRGQVREQQVHPRGVSVGADGRSGRRGRRGIVGPLVRDEAPQSGGEHRTGLANTALPPARLRGGAQGGGAVGAAGDAVGGRASGRRQDLLVQRHAQRPHAIQPLPAPARDDAAEAHAT